MFFNNVLPITSLAEMRIEIEQLKKSINYNEFDKLKDKVKNLQPHIGLKKAIEITFNVEVEAGYDGWAWYVSSGSMCATIINLSDIEKIYELSKKAERYNEFKKFMDIYKKENKKKKERKNK